MSPTEAIAAGGASGLTVVTLGTIFIRHLVTQWLKKIDELPGRIEKAKQDLERDTARLRVHVDTESGKLRTHVDTSTTDVRRYAEHEFELMRNSGHVLQNKVGIDIGVLSNRVSVAEKSIDELKDEVAEFREDLHRVDSNVILIAAKVGAEPLLPRRRGE